MNLIIQGMRRSGTTIFYDALTQDSDLTTWYEPLAEAKKPSADGGSILERDLFDTLRVAREKFVVKNGVKDPRVFNYGAPRDATLEFEETLPAIVREYLRFLFNYPGTVIAKFTRLYCKVQLMAEIVPGAVFVHLVRDPRSVVASYLFGKQQRHKKNFPTPDVFFWRRSNCTAWSSYALSELILDQPGWAKYGYPFDFERILLIWKFTFEETRRRGIAAFGERYKLLRHEDFCSDPVGQLESVYRTIDRTLPENVRAWALDHVRSASIPYAANDSRWQDSFVKLDMIDTLNVAGYSLTE